MSTDTQTEQEIQAKGLTAPRVTPDDIEANIASEHYFTAADGVFGADTHAIRAFRPDRALTHVPLNDEKKKPTPLDHVTICVLITRNGTKLVGANEGPVSADNFDAEMGRRMARKKAIDQLWPMLGYELRSKLHAG